MFILEVTYRNITDNDFKRSTWTFFVLPVTFSLKRQELFQRSVLESHSLDLVKLMKTEDRCQNAIE